MATASTTAPEHMTTDPLHKSSDPQRATITPTPPVRHPVTQAEPKRHRIWKPSPDLLKLRELSYFPGWYTKSPECPQKQRTQRKPKQLPVNLPPLQAKVKMNCNVVSTLGRPTGPDSKKNDGQSDPHLREFRRSHKCLKQQNSAVIPKPPQQFMKTEPHRPHDQSTTSLHPLHLPNQDVMSTPSFSTWLFSLMSEWEGSRKLAVDSFHDSLVHSRDEYIIVSDEMVVLMCDDPVYITLDRWERLCLILPKIIRIPFFAHFTKRRPFSIWRSKVRSKKFNLARNALKGQLFTLNQCLRPALADIWNMCSQISETGLFHIEPKHTYTLWDFQDTQVKQLQKTLIDLEKFQDLVKELTICACHNYLSPQAESENSAEQMKLRCLTQIKKSFRFTRVRCFIRLVDCLITSSFHQMVVKAVAHVLSVLQQQLSQRPSQSWSHSESEDGESIEEETSSDPSMFITELVLDTKALTFDPSEDNFQESFSQTFGQMKQTVMAVGTLTDDPDFDSVTERKDNKTLRYDDTDVSNLECVMSGDEHLQSLIHSIKECLHSSFHTARAYSRTLERFRVFYKDNEGLDLDLLQQQDHDLAFFEKSLARYSREQKEGQAVEQTTQLGLLLVEKTRFRDKFEASLHSRLEVVNEMLAQLARRSLDAVSTEVYEAQFKLRALPPSATLELGNYLTSLDDIQDRVVFFEKEKTEVCRLYKLISTYSVPISSEDQIAFTQLEPAMILLHSLVSDALSIRDSTVEEFLSSLSRDVTGLSCKLEELKPKLLDPQFLDINSDFLQVSLLLGDIRITVDELQHLASTYTSYQKKFMLEVTTFGILEELKVELRLRQLLWDSVQEWDSSQNGWRMTKLQQLDVDHIRSQILKYDKYVDQLEKGLPKNSVVTRLKDKMEAMRHMLPVVADLCSLCVDLESWKSLETILGTSLDVETLTLSFLEESDIVSHTVKIQEVANQLSKTTY